VCRIMADWSQEMPVIYLATESSMGPVGLASNMTDAAKEGWRAVAIAYDSERGKWVGLMEMRSPAPKKRRH